MFPFLLRNIYNKVPVAKCENVKEKEVGYFTAIY